MSFNQPHIARLKRLHVKLSADEHKKLKLVADHEGVGISDYVRPMVMQAVEREIDARGLRTSVPHRSAFAMEPAATPGQE